MERGEYTVVDGEDNEWRPWHADHWDITVETDMGAPPSTPTVISPPDDSCVRVSSVTGMDIRMSPDDARTVASRLVWAADAADRALGRVP